MLFQTNFMIRQTLLHTFSSVDTYKHNTKCFRTWSDDSTFPNTKQEGIHLIPREINGEEEGERGLILSLQNQHWDTISSFIYAPDSLPENTGGSLKEWVMLFSLSLSLSISPPHLSFSKQLQKSNSLRGRELQCLPCGVSVCLCIHDVSLKVAHNNKTIYCFYHVCFAFSFYSYLFHYYVCYFSISYISN